MGGVEVTMIEASRNAAVALAVRDLISLDMWRVVNALGEQTCEPCVGAGECCPTPAAMLDLLNRTVITLAAFGGLASESMTRGEGWRFLDMGRRLSRAYNLADKAYILVEDLARAR